MRINKQAVIEVLGGNMCELLHSFSWHRTPQGSGHWFDIVFGHKKLSKRSRQYLNKLLNS